MLVSGWYQTIFSQSKCQIHTFPLCFPIFYIFAGSVYWLFILSSTQKHTNSPSSLITGVQRCLLIHADLDSNQHGEFSYFYYILSKDNMAKTEPAAMLEQ